jgi:peptidoglycan hydrolase CwlO-like protein
MDVKGEVKAPNKSLFLLIPILNILAAVAFVFAFSANGEAQKYKKLFEKEMAFRLDMEEKVNQLRSEKVEFTSVVDNKDSEIKEKDNKISELTKIVDSKDTEIADLKAEVEKLSSLNNQPQQSESVTTPPPTQQ